MHGDGPLSARPRVVRAPCVVGSVGIPVDLDEAARMSQHLTSGGHHEQGHVRAARIATLRVIIEPGLGKDNPRS